MKAAPSIRRWNLLRAVHHDHIRRSLPQFASEPHLLLQDLLYEVDHGVGVRRLRRCLHQLLHECPGIDREIIAALQACLIDHGLGEIQRPGGAFERRSAISAIDMSVTLIFTPSG
jgi:hypothetical protein